MDRRPFLLKGAAMQVMEQIIERCKAARPHIVLSEGDDTRTQDAAGRAAADGLARVTLIGAGIEAPDGVEVIDPAASDRLASYSAEFFQMREHKGLTQDAATAAMRTRLGFAAMMVRRGDADGTLGGAVETTSDVVRTALQVIGKSPDVDVVSSCFLMLLQAPYDRPVIFSDCGLVIEPDARELASIAQSSVASLGSLTGQDAKVAFLSFSTKGSVPTRAHASLERIEEAMERFATKMPSVPFDGELQFDAAIIPDVAARKAPESAIGGDANVFVFPDLNAGNIAYKIAQRIGGATALGPILQGLAKPANDLSRGATADDIYKMIAITGAQAAAT